MRVKLTDHLPPVADVLCQEIEAKGTTVQQAEERAKIGSVLAIGGDRYTSTSRTLRYMLRYRMDLETSWAVWTDMNNGYSGRENQVTSAVSQSQ